MLGAGVAFAYVISGQPLAWTAAAQSPAGGSQPTNVVATAPTTTTPPPPPVSEILPFNAKLTSQDIPVPNGGVRSGACSGALVAPRWVVTAGHCFHDINDTRIGGPPQYTMTVTVGKLKDSDPGGYTAQVVDVRQSPVNDLAVVRLSTAINGVVPVTLAEAQPAIGQQLQFAGWGSLSSTVLGPSDHLKRGQFTVSSIGQHTLEAQSIEAPRTVENVPCPEDSGAPFFTTEDERTGTLVAIVNSGPPCPQAGAEIIARVDVVADWIRQQILSG